MADEQVALPVLTPGQPRESFVEMPTSSDGETGGVESVERLEVQVSDVSEPLEGVAPVVEESAEVDEESAEEEDMPFDPALFPFHTEDIFESRIPRQQPFPFFDVPELPLPEDLPIREILPFVCGFDDGPSFVGRFVVHRPMLPEQELPFFPVEDQDMGQVSLLKKLPFQSSFYHHEFTYNYMRGVALRELRRTPKPADDTIVVTPKAAKVKPAKKKSAKTGALQDIYRLPKELLLDILEFMTPMDLLNLSQVSKPLRSLLLSKDVVGVWEVAFSSFTVYDSLCPPIPKLPSPGAPSISYPPAKWAAMLFDDNTKCDFCGELGALIDYAFETRYCDGCQLKHLQDSSDRYDINGDDLPRHNEVIWDLLVPTYRECGRSYQTRWLGDVTNARYRKVDIDSMKEELTRWFVTIDEGVMPDAGEKFEEWKTNLANTVSAIREYAHAANDWAIAIYYRRNSELSDHQLRLAKEVGKRMLKLGHDQRDIESAEYDFYSFLRNAEVYRLKHAFFEANLAEFVSLVNSRKGQRLQEERKTLVTKTYDDYRKTLKPDQWQFQPPVEIIQEEQAFNAFIRQDPDLAPQELTPEAVGQIPKIVSDWVRNQRVSLYELLPGVQMPDRPVHDTTEETEEQFQARMVDYNQTVDALMDHRMSLASAIFSCNACKSGRHAGKAVVGWKAVCAHMCGSWPKAHHTNWEFCSVGYAAAASIIRMLGLDPEVATPEDVDNIDARFFCFNCPVTLHRKLRGRKAYTWRECVTHAVDKEQDHTHASPAWVRLSEDATNFVRAHELPFPNPRKPNWGCNHCSEHFEVAATRKDAIEHVKTSHSIEAPILGVDFLDFKNRYEKGGAYRLRHTFHYSIEPACQLLCKLCTPGKVKRLRNVQGLVPHLFHKHKISMPVSGRDYCKIELLHE